MKVFYREEQNAVNAETFSPSAGKPAQVVAYWLQRREIVPGDVLPFEPVSREDLYRAHDRGYVDSILDLQDDNGFGNRDAQVAASLPYTSGSMLAAARYALEHSTHVCSPTSGFHHAGWEYGGGFCTFNGLMVTALALKAAGLVRRVGIIDLDMHYGDGTADIITRLGIDWIVHRTQGGFFRDRKDVGADARDYFQWLQRAIDACADVDVVLYQAGADPHVNDPLGGLLTEVELAIRDHQVFKALRGRPVAWNLAGGYQRSANGGIEPVLKIHHTTAVACRVHLGEIEV